ncbi:MAG: hypothetical protein P8Y58_09445 [Novosphingobium sp.]
MLDTYNMRRQREKIFGAPQLFGEPTWDILLDLFIADLRNTRMQTTSVCIGSQVPQTTALRWISLLEKENLVHRYRDKEDCRRVYVQLTDIALRKMVQLFYDRCFWLFEKKKNSAAKLNGLPPSINELEDAREAVLNEAITLIRTGGRGLN